jgi:KDO2-lipid IV(A) lauroyltransferase
MSPLARRLRARLVAGFIAAVQALPWRALPPLATILGWLWATVVPVRRSLMHHNLALAFPGRDRAWRTRVIRACCRHFVLTGLEMFWLPRMDRDWVRGHVRVNDPGLPARLRERGRGVICVGGHYGNWEVIGAALAVEDQPLSYIVKRVADPLLDRLLNDSRRSVGAEIIYTREAGRQVLKHLKRNRLVAFLSDQDARDRGVFVDFLGHPASTPQGAAVYALRLGAPLMFMHDRRVADGHHEVELLEIPLEPHWTLCDDHIRLLTQRYTDLLAGRITAEPEQWFWMHRRWKTKKGPEKSDKSDKSDRSDSSDPSDPDPAP